MPVITAPSLLRRTGSASGVAKNRRASKPLRTYGTSKRRKLHQDPLELSLATFDEKNDVGLEAGSSPTSEHAAFMDSAYQSMTATLDEGSDEEAASAMRDGLDIAMAIEPANSQGLATRNEKGGSASGKLHRSRGERKRRHSSISQQEDTPTEPLRTDYQNREGALVEATPEKISDRSRSRKLLRPENTPSGDADIEESPTVRTSGRQRKLSRKLEELFAADQVKNVPRPGSVTVKQRRGGKDDVLPSTPTRKRGRPPKTLPIEGLLPEPNSSALFEDTCIQTPVARAALWPKKKTPVIRSNIDGPATVEISLPEPDVADASAAGLETDSPDLPVLSEHAQPTGNPFSAPSESFQHLSTLLEDPRYHSSFATLKSQILAGLTGKRRLPLIGLEEEYRKVFQVVEQTIVAGEGNSMLVVGARGSAKTTLVETVLSHLASEREEDFHVVRLNGFIHTDDKIALKEIWRQLGREMSVDETGAKGPTNYADTLASLLALLSHTSDPPLADEHARTTSKAVIFILDEFDRFAGHGRQTLLYNLFDIAQSRKAPIAVLGLTTRLDVMESLEKRVKSRFSHRYVYLPWPKTLASFRRICEAALHCTDLSPVSSPHDTCKHDSNSHDTSSNRNDLLSNSLQSAWSNHITSLLTSDPTVSHLLRTIYARSKSVPSFTAACLVPIATMTPTALPTAAAFSTTTTTTDPAASRLLLLPPDSKLDDLLPGLSELELSLLIAAARLDIVLDTDTCNFNMAYDEYFRLASRARMQTSAGGVGGGGGAAAGAASGAAGAGTGARVWSREVALGAWERLERLSLLVPVASAGGAGGLTQLGRAGRLWKVDVALEEIGASRLDVSAVVAKWCRVI